MRGFVYGWKRACVCMSVCKQMRFFRLLCPPPHPSPPHTRSPSLQADIIKAFDLDGRRERQAAEAKAASLGSKYGSSGGTKKKR